MSDGDQLPPSRVLVVDDDPHIANDYLNHFRRYGRHDYIGTETAESGLDRLRGTQIDTEIDIVIVDFELNDGWSALNFIEKARQIRPHLPYVIWSHHSEKRIHEEMRRVPIDSICRTVGDAFIQKSSVLQSGAGALDQYIDRVVVQFREQLLAQLNAATVGAFKEVELILTQVVSIRRGLDQACAHAPLHTRTIPLRPMRLHALRAEQRLRKLLNYELNDNRVSPGPQEFEAALEELLSSSVALEIPVELLNCIQRIVNHDLTSKGRSNSRKLATALQRAGTKSPNVQEKVAEFTSDLLDLLVMAGRPKQAHEISTELWTAANSGWEATPRTTCALAHALTLAGSGQRELAEHLASGILSEVETRLDPPQFDELARMIFAEIDGRSRIEASP